MRAIMVMFDSLRLDMLPCYGGKEISLPNFDRLAKRTVTFDNSYACSLPCMPARRELHTGRPNFLHRSWGPIEPFDDSMPELLKQNGIYTHLVTDHYHYVEDGGCTYHSRYNSWDCIRGQEGDAWCGSAEPRTEASPHMFPMAEGIPKEAKDIHIKLGYQDVINRRQLSGTRTYPMCRTFDGGVTFINDNARYDNWFLQLETFDPHEPFDVPTEYAKLLLDPDSMSQLDWPPYAPVQESPEIVDEVRKKYLALVAFCDTCMGRVLDAMDANNMWDDTMLIVNTDHGFLLSEHNWWGKMAMPDYNEITHTPLFVWDPCAGTNNERCDSLVQTIDIAPTLLEYFGVTIPKDMLGKPLNKAIQGGASVHDYAIFGAFGSVLNITDGEFVYMLAPANYDAPKYEYTLMPTHMRSRFSPEEMRTATMVDGFEFTKGCPLMKIEAGAAGNIGAGPSKLPEGGHLLFNLKADPKQLQPVENIEVEQRMRQALYQQLKLNDAPWELYTRYGL